MSDVTERFVALVQGPPGAIALDEAALLIAAHAHTDLDLDARLGQLDALGDGVASRDARGVADALFDAGGFTGNTVDYSDPANSYLDDVLDRRLGIPITLGVVMIEVARRAGVHLVGVGMPRHFLVGVPTMGDDGPGIESVTQWYDPFHGAQPLDASDCAALFARMHGGTGPVRPLDPAHLAPVGPLAILDRMLANLQITLLRRAPASAAWPTRLRLAFPAVSPFVRAELASTLGNLGQFAEAAAHLDALVGELDPETAERVARAAGQLRARAN